MKRAILAVLMAAAASLAISNFAVAHPDHPHPTKEPSEKPSQI